jgi:hypothetical protein
MLGRAGPEEAEPEELEDPEEPEEPEEPVDARYRPVGFPPASVLANLYATATRQPILQFEIPPIKPLRLLDEVRQMREGGLPDPLGCAFPSPRVLVELVGVTGFGKLYALCKAWAFASVDEARFLSDVRELFVFTTPLYGVRFAISAMVGGRCVGCHSDSAFYRPHSRFTTGHSPDG